MTEISIPLYFRLIVRLPTDFFSLEKMVIEVSGDGTFYTPLSFQPTILCKSISTDGEDAEDPADNVLDGRFPCVHQTCSFEVNLMMEPSMRYTNTNSGFRFIRLRSRHLFEFHNPYWIYDFSVSGLPIPNDLE